MKTDSHRNPHSPLRHRLGIGVRILTAVAGSYLFAMLASAALALSLPLPRTEAIIAGGLASFVLFPLSVIWTFAASSALRACLGVLTPSLVLAIAIWILRGTL